MDNEEADDHPDTGKFERFDSNFAWLRRQFTADDGLLVGLNKEMSGLRDNLTVVEVKVDKLEGKVDKLEGKVDKLQAGVDEILDRLPTKAA